MKSITQRLSFFDLVRRVGLIGAVLSIACNDSPIDPPSSDSAVMELQGRGAVAERFTGEVWVHGDFAYTTTWSFRGVIPGNAVKIWDVSAAGAPVLLDSLIVPNATTLGDVQVSDDGSLLVVATEREPGSIMIYDLANPVNPTLITRYSTPRTNAGVHTAEIQRVNGRLYAFLSIDPPARLVIVDITAPSAPVEVFTAPMGAPFIHDVFVRDGILFTALWDDGLSIWDLGGAGAGSVASPRLIGNVMTFGGQVHNVWWYHAPDGAKSYAFVGEEGPGVVGSSASGDIHVVDVTDLAAPREVAFFRVPGAGTHNFSVDEARGILYAAFYNGGVRAIDITGDLSACSAAEKNLGRCDLGRMGREVAHGLLDEGSVFVWGVHYVPGTGKVYASDMLNGLWVLQGFIPGN